MSQSWVKVCDDLTQYLPETTETRRGLTLMEDEMKTYGTARIIVSHVTYEIARDLADQIEDLNNISSVDFWDADKSADDTTLPPLPTRPMRITCSADASSPSPSGAKTMTSPPRTVWPL